MSGEPAAGLLTAKIELLIPRQDGRCSRGDGGGKLSESGVSEDGLKIGSLLTIRLECSSDNCLIAADEAVGAGDKRGP